MIGGVLTAHTLSFPKMSGLPAGHMKRAFLYDDLLWMGLVLDHKYHSLPAFPPHTRVWRKTKRSEFFSGATTFSGFLTPVS